MFILGSQQKKHCSKLSFSKVRFLHRTRPFCVFERLRATYDDHLRLIGKRVVDFLVVLL